MTQTPGTRENRSGFLAPTLMTVAMLALLVSLGIWQLQRMAWKEGLIAGIAARAHGSPVALSETAAEYTRVRLKGRFLHQSERHLLMTGPEGPGVHVITPFLTDANELVLVNRGFVPDGLIDPKTRPESEVQGPVEVIGLVRRSEVPGTFTPLNEPAKNIWYWRDATAMLAGVPVQSPAHGKAIPVFIDQELTAIPGGWPRGGVTNLDLPNRHLEYAFTWFAFAATLAAIYAIYMTKRLMIYRQGPKPPA